MNAILTIAGATIHEAARRRLLAAVAVLTLIVIALSAWGFHRLATYHDRTGAALSSPELAVTSAIFTVFLAFVFSFVLAVGAAFVAAPALAADVESGLALAILVRPIRRADVVVGKWLGIVTLLVGYAAVAGTLELLTIRAMTNYVPPHPATALAYLAATSIIVATFALACSARIPALASGVIAVVLFGVAWIGGITGEFGAFVGNPSLTDAGTISSLVLPSDALWRGALYALEPAALIAGVNGSARGGLAAGPFSVEGPPTTAMLLWSAGWLIVVLAAAAWSFTRRNI